MNSIIISAIATAAVIALAPAKSNASAGWEGSAASSTIIAPAEQFHIAQTSPMAPLAPPDSGGVDPMAPPAPTGSDPVAPSAPTSTGVAAPAVPDSPPTTKLSAPVQNYLDKYENFLTSSGISKIVGKNLLVTSCEGCVPYIINCRRPIANAENLRGKNVRVSSVTEKFVRKLGGKPLQMPGGEVLIALKSGVIECVVGGGLQPE